MNPKEKKAFDDAELSYRNFFFLFVEAEKMNLERIYQKNCQTARGKEKVSPGQCHLSKSRWMKFLNKQDFQ